MLWRRRRKKRGAAPPAATFDSIGEERVWEAGRQPYVGTGTGGLRELARRRLVTTLLGGLSPGPPGVVLLVDDASMRLLSSLFRLSEVMEYGVHLVENVTMKAADGSYLRRQPLRELPAVYLLTPSVESINRVIEDFREPAAPSYRGAYLFFTSRLSDPLMTKLRKSSAFPHVRALHEVAIEYVLHESNVFTTPASASSFHALFKGDTSPRTSQSKLQEAYRLATSLSTVFPALCDAGDSFSWQMPIVRSGPGPIASSIAAATQEKLDALSASLPERVQAPRRVAPTKGGDVGRRADSGSGPDGDRPVLLVLDRSFDPLSPLLHEFTYQAMAYDLLPITDDGRYRYTYQGNNNRTLSREVLLSESDPLWLKYRHMHIADLTEAIDADYKSFLAANHASTSLNRGGADLKAMAEGLRAMPKFQEAMSRWSLHISLTSDLVNRYEMFSLEKVALLEQSMACGESADGKSFKADAALSELEGLFRASTPLSPIDGLRLLMIYAIVHGGIKPDDRRRMMDAAGIGPEDQVAMLNLFHLNVSMVPGQLDRQRPMRETGGTRDSVLHLPPSPDLCTHHSAPAATAASPSPINEDPGYDVSRYCPPIRRIAHAAMTGCLDDQRYAYIRRTDGAHDARGGATTTSGLHSWSNPFDDDLAAEDTDAPPVRLASWATMSSDPSLGSNLTDGVVNANATDRRRRRLVIFVAGGVTYAEMRELLDLGSRMRIDIFVGATSLLTPQRYLLELKGLQQLEAPGTNPTRVQQRA